MNRVFKERQRPTLPPWVVPSALTGLTSLFGMGRGETCRNNHLKLFRWLNTYVLTYQYNGIAVDFYFILKRFSPV